MAFFRLRNLYLISIGFLCLTLYRFDFLTIPTISSPTALLVSIVLLIAGLSLDARVWQVALSHHGHTLRLSDHLAAMGVSIFGKYIPGKVWLLVGRVGYLSRYAGAPTAAASSAAVTTQIVAIWVGTSIGAAVLLALDAPTPWLVSTVVALGFLTFFLFSSLTRGLLGAVIGRVLRRDFPMEALNFRAALHVGAWSLLFWAMLGLAFSCFATAIYGWPFDETLAPIFVLSCVLGLVALFAPGGIGAREGALASVLILAGQSAEAATTLAVFSRLWFILAETGVFLIGLTLHRRLIKTTLLGETTA